MLQIGYRTHKGVVRTHNEDACFILPEKDIYIVADGVGGRSAGEVASRTCVYEITQYVNRNSLPEYATAIMVRDYLKDCIDKVNDIIYSRELESEEGQGMATTLVLCCVRGNYAYIGHVGDSRAYILRNGKLIQITEDHTYVNALLQAGVISSEEARTHEKRHMITRAVGAEKDIKPDFKQVEIREGDIILLCTDGLTGEVDDERIAQILSEDGITMAQASDRLIKEANDVGGNDNVTAICLRV